MKEEGEINKLFEDNIRLAYSMAQKIYSKHKDYFEFDDIKQHCLIGLFKACKTFDKSKGFTLGTYSARVMYNEFNMILRKMNFKYKIHSFDSIVESSKNESLCFIDMIGTEDLELKNIENNIGLLDYINKNFKDRDLKIIYKILKGEKQKAIGKEFNLSQAQIARIRKKLKDKINKIL